MRRLVTLAAAMGIISAIVAVVSVQTGASGAGATSNVLLDSPKAVGFHDQMRKLWEDHVTWTRLAIVSAVGGTDGVALPDTGATVTRLQQNQDDIGAAIVPYFGQAAGDPLAALLHAHITGAVNLVLAAKAGDTAAVAAAKTCGRVRAGSVANSVARTDVCRAVGRDASVTNEPRRPR